MEAAHDADIAYQLERIFVADFAALVHISAMAFVCSLKLFNCLLMNSV